MISSHVQQHIQAFLSLRGDTALVTANCSLVISGRLQSLDVVELAMWLEREYHLDFAKHGFNQYDFDSVSSIFSIITPHPT